MRDDLNEDFVLFELGFGIGLGWAGSALEEKQKLITLAFLKLGMKHEVLFWANFFFFFKFIFRIIFCFI